MTAETVAYGQWPSPLDTAAVFSQPQAPQFPQQIDGRLHFLRSLPDQAGRIALIRREADGQESILSPEGYNIRTRVHEYGGQCHLLRGDTCWFVNFADQRLYRQSLSGGEPVAITPLLSKGWMLADLCLHPQGRWLLAVGERERVRGENQNALLAIDLQATEPTDCIHIMIKGADFYCSPTLSPSGDRLAFVSWDHPNMPWDRSALHVAPFEATTGELGDTVAIVDGQYQSACQPVFEQDGSLVYACDQDMPAGQEGAPGNYWNLYRYGPDSRHEAITDEAVEYGAPHWVFGYQRIQPIGGGRLLAVGLSEQGEQLEIVSSHGRRIIAGGLQADSTPGYAGFRQLTPVDSGVVLLVAERTDRGASVLSVEVATGQLSTLIDARPLMGSGDVSAARPVSAPTRDGAITHAWAYGPRNARVTAPVGDRPPLVVMVHGGPTSRSGPAFDPLKQFWSTRGFAVLDVNHRGSTGHGRAYRQALHGQWGLIDVDDVVDAIAHYTGQGLADPKRVFIRGGSAGGFTVLAALTRYPDVFAAGACYYGIGNLATLAASTHKFEARYLDSLLGEPWHESLASDTASVYYTRSPIHHMSQVRSPMILLQGKDDKVVPPEVSREVVRVLEHLGIAHRYIEYEGEGHGFRIAANRLHALEAESAFFQDVMTGNPILA